MVLYESSKIFRKENLAYQQDLKILNCEKICDIESTNIFLNFESILAVMVKKCSLILNLTPDSLPTISNIK